MQQHDLSPFTNLIQVFKKTELCSDLLHVAAGQGLLYNLCE